MNADGSGMTRLTNDPGKHGHPAWSPDGKRIAFTNEVGGVSDIYTMNADGSGVVRLTRDPFASSDPAWSPAGTRIAFTRAIGGFVSRIAVMNADGSSVALVSAPPAYPYDIMDSAPAWSPDGSKIAFNRSYYDDLTPSTIYVMQADGSGAHVLNVQSGPQPGSFMSYAEAAPAWSPDGTRILFWSYWASPFAAAPMVPHSASPGYALRKSDGSGDLMLLPISVPVTYSNTPDWSPDGNHVVFASGTDIYTANVDGSGMVRLTSGDQPAWRR
jgi:Tol biopolymer transport system component